MKKILMLFLLLLGLLFHFRNIPRTFSAAAGNSEPGKAEAVPIDQ